MERKGVEGRWRESRGGGGEKRKGERARVSEGVMKEREGGERVTTLPTLAPLSP